MRYKPVVIAHVFETKNQVKDGRVISIADRTRAYFMVLGGMVGNCGHKHKTEKAAAPCLRRLKKAWTEKRSLISQVKAAQRAARANIARLSAMSNPTNNNYAEGM